MALTILIQRFFTRVLEPEAHFLEIDPKMAARLGWVITALTLLFALEEGVDALIAGQNASLEVSITNQVIFSLLASGILIFLIRPLQSGFIRVLTFALILTITASTLSGYVALGRLLATRGVLSLVLLVGMRVFFRIIDAVSRMLLAPGRGLGAALRARLNESEEDADILVFWLGIVFKTLLILSGLLGLLLLWSLDRKDLLIWMTDAFQGFRVGSLTISPSAILTGFSLFIFLLGVTRFLQRVLEEKVFPKTRLDSGIRHSVRSGFGYLGFGLSSMLAISVMGVDLSNLAIIAGALSVGIGFGLQNIVNNFVSGLILLIERPIKAGDWVVVDGHQGLVRKISVRATQISTFDRTTVYIPNSSLISGAVQNKTNPDRVGRIVLPLHVDQDQEIDAVQALLIQMASALPEVRKHPAPSVFVTGLSETQIHLDWVVFVQDVESIQKVTSQLYKALLAAYKVETIRRKPAKPQELHVRLLDPPPSEAGA
jgi:small-conductance mechanosensitive channel